MRYIHVRGPRARSTRACFVPCVDSSAARRVLQVIRGSMAEMVVLSRGQKPTTMNKNAMLIYVIANVAPKTPSSAWRQQGLSAQMRCEPSWSPPTICRLKRINAARQPFCQAGLLFVFGRTIAARVGAPFVGKICGPALLQAAAFQEGDQSPSAGVSRSRLVIRRSEKAAFDRLDDLPKARSCVREQRDRRRPFATDDMS